MLKGERLPISWGQKASSLTCVHESTEQRLTSAKGDGQVLDRKHYRRLSAINTQSQANRHLTDNCGPVCLSGLYVDPSTERKGRRRSEMSVINPTRARFVPNVIECSVYYDGPSDFISFFSYCICLRRPRVTHKCFEWIRPANSCEKTPWEPWNMCKDPWPLR